MRMFALSRAIWMILGCLAVALGVLGIVLPLLPTTVFLLMAAYCFARSSPVLHDWLVDHPTLGPPITNWRDHRAISRRAKWLALTSMVVILAAGAFFGLGATILTIQSVVLGCAALFIVTRPSPPAA